MIVVLTRPDFIPNEVDAIVRLFDERGIDRLHIRKPGAEEDDVAALLARLPARLYPRLSIHDHHALAVRFGLGGIHLNSRQPVPPEGWTGGLSVSCHSIAELAARKAEPFDYLSLSPIFDSISKQGYQAAFSPHELAEARAAGIIDSRVLALGGVTFDRLDVVHQMGFGGGMILGDAWR